MNLIKAAIERPVAVVAAVLMLIMFGILALEMIPVQLAPDVRRPVITVETIWPGAAPADIEREIVNRQEDVLKGLEGLEQMLSSSKRNIASITLEFRVGSNMDRALLLVANRLDRVSGYPTEADEPTLKTSGSEDNPIAWIVVKRAAGNTQAIHKYGDFIEDTIRPRIERLPGVGAMAVYGGVERELRMFVHPQKIAQYGLTIPQIVSALRQANVSLSAGTIDEGKRSYAVRTEGEFAAAADISAVLVKSQMEPTGNMTRVTVGDIAEVKFHWQDPQARIRHLGEPAIAFNVQRETGANVIETMEQLNIALTELKSGPLAGANLTLTQVYDETVYIDSAVTLVKQNIIIGGVLAAIMLLLFLRSMGATLIISIAIPVSVIGAFVAMAALGRTINVISLAGIAFAVGMVVDAAIVVLENIFRLRQQGVPVAMAAYRGAQQVWGAILVSALTTVMVFLPIMVMDVEVGQLFRDIAVAISVAVMLSLVVSITVIPALSKHFISSDLNTIYERRRVPLLDGFARKFTAAVTGFTATIVAAKKRAVLLVVLLSIASVSTTVLLLPKLEYLPEGNRNLVFGMILPPPGYNLETTTDIGIGVEQAIKPLWASETGPISEAGQPPKIDNFFFVSLGNLAFVGASAVEPERARELIGPLQGPVFAEPGTYGFMTQPSIFGRGIGGGRSVQLDISGPELDVVLGVAMQAAGKVFGMFPRQAGHQVRPIPGLEMGAPEVRLKPNRQKLADNGVTAIELSQTVDAYNDGLRVAEITVDGKRIDLMLSGPHDYLEHTQGVGELPIMTLNGSIVPVKALTDIIHTEGPTEIRHVERQRTVTLEIRPSDDMALEEALKLLKDQVVTEMADKLPAGVSINLSGTADQLDATWNALQMQLLVALFIVYLVMAVLFESFVYPMVIMLSVPLATAGAVLGLDALGTWQGWAGMPTQKLDMLTMLGFIILVGIVVNNAILLVHQTLHHMREDAMDASAAIVEATRNRIRPIFMSTLTSVLGMLPLVLVPGAGSELYRGLGSVVLGGLSLSAILTLAIIPALLILVLPRNMPKSAEEVV